jgi:outer membrane protein assembly factor BamB
MSATKTIKLAAFFLIVISLAMFVSTQSSNSESTSEWKMFGRTLDNNRYYNDTVNMTNFGVLWTYTVGDSLSFGFDTNGTFYIDGTGIPSSPAVANGMVYFGSLDNKTYALNASTGQQIWNYTTGDDIYSSIPLPQSPIT